MFQVFKDEMLLSGLMFLSLVWGVLGKIMLGAFYQNMIKETENMRTTENKVLKQCKLKFANCYKLSNGVSNVSAFVDKYLGGLKIGPFTTRTFYHLSGQAVLLSVLFAGVAVCHQIITGAGIHAILPYYIVSFLGLYLYFSVSAIADVRGRRKILKTNLIDFFENHMGNRLENEETEGGKNRQNIELMPVRSKPAPVSFPPPAPMPDLAAQSRQSAAFGQSSAFSPLEQRELEDLLKEFLTS